MKKALFKLLVSRKAIGQTVKYVAAFAAAAAITAIAGAPGWVQGLLDYLAENAGLEMNEAGLTALFALVIAEVGQFAIDRSNAKGVEKIQEALGEVKDSWAGDQTTDAVDNLKARFNVALEEIKDLRDKIEEASEQAKNDEPG